jgi:Flp pilus assembly protein TadG
MSGGRLRGDRGAAVIEAALVLPVVITFVTALFDFGLVALQTSQATSAAADGAREAILRPTACTNTSTSADCTKIRAAATRHLAGQAVTDFEVRCLGPEGAAVACSPAGGGRDRVVTTVKWRYRPVTFVGAVLGERTIRGTSATVTVGLPVGTPAAASAA